MELFYLGLSVFIVIIAVALLSKRKTEVNSDYFE
jgi:hypothetical protein